MKWDVELGGNGEKNAYVIVYTYYMHIVLYRFLERKRKRKKIQSFVTFHVMDLEIKMKRAKHYRQRDNLVIFKRI